jgi:LacI family transcriptional regulator
MKKTKPTIKDVAAAAGVSVSTVSKYVNATQRFSPTVEARLKGAIEELGYRSDPLARSMVTGKTRTIGLTILDISNPHFTSIVKGANRIALQHDYTLLLVDTEESQQRERALLESLALRVDGMLVSSRLADESLQWLLDLDKPIVMLGRSERLPNSSVGTDSHLAAYMLTRHLLSLGHRRIAYLGFPKSRWNDERLAGIEDCLREQGLSSQVHEAPAPSAAAGEDACSAIMLAPNPPEAVVCYNDLMALGFIKELRALGFRLPQDVSVAGFDNVPYGEYASPSLTTVDLQSEKMGEFAMTRLINELGGNAERGYSMLEPRLVIRESTGSRPTAAGSAE